jgi:tRNA (mo5U34)-methyltransferase
MDEGQRSAGRKRFRVAGVEIDLRLNAAQAARIRRSVPYRYAVRPAVQLVRRPTRRTAEPARFALPEPAPPPATADPAVARIWTRIAGLRWYQTIDLGHGVVTPGFIDHRATVDRYGLPDDLSGRRCLDVGTYDGFWAFEMERRGADVVAMDVDSPLDLDVPRLQRQRMAENGDALQAVGVRAIGDGFRVASELLGSRVERRVANLYDLSPATFGRFDITFVSEVLLHLRDPQTALENLRAITTGFVIVAETYRPELERQPAALSEFVGTTSVGIWWGHSTGTLKRMLDVAGFEPIEEVGRLQVRNRLGEFSKVVLKGHVPEHACESTIGGACAPCH